MLTLVDNRSGVAGRCRRRLVVEHRLQPRRCAGRFVPVFGGAGGWYQHTAGQVVTAAFTDAYNNIITAVRNYAPQSMGDRGMGTGGPPDRRRLVAATGRIDCGPTRLPARVEPGSSANLGA